MEYLLCRLAAACLCGLFTLVTSAQSTPSTASDEFHYRPDRQVIVYENGHLLTQEGSWAESSPLRVYADIHRTLAGGNFVLFRDADGPIRQLTDRKILVELQATYTPMKALNAQQQALSEQQKPLAAQQSALSIKMRAAATPAQMTEIGQEQGKIGRLQGQVGHQQGLVGQQQGTIGRAFYTQLQNALDSCLRANTCPAVTPSHTS